MKVLKFLEIQPKYNSIIQVKDGVIFQKPDFESGF